jgi:hypothetical protein
MLRPGGGREEPSNSSVDKGVPRDQCPQGQEIISRNSSRGLFKIMWLLGLLLLLILNGFWWFGRGGYQKPLANSQEPSSSSTVSQHPYSKYLAIENIYYHPEKVGKGKGQKRAVFWNFKATLKNISSREITDIEGYWHLVDLQSQEHREKIYISRLSPGDSKEIFMQVRKSEYFHAPGIARNVVIEQIKLKEAANSP